MIPHKSADFPHDNHERPHFSWFPPTISHPLYESLEVLNVRHRNLLSYFELFPLAWQWAALRESCGEANFKEATSGISPIQVVSW